MSNLNALLDEAIAYHDGAKAPLSKPHETHYVEIFLDHSDHLASLKGLFASNFIEPMMDIPGLSLIGICSNGESAKKVASFIERFIEKYESDYSRLPLQKGWLPDLLRNGRLGVSGVSSSKVEGNVENPFANLIAQRKAEALAEDMLAESFNNLEGYGIDEILSFLISETLSAYPELASIPEMKSEMDHLCALANKASKVHAQVIAPRINDKLVAIPCKVTTLDQNINAITTARQELARVRQFINAKDIVAQGKGETEALQNKVVKLKPLMLTAFDTALEPVQNTSRRQTLRRIRSSLDGIRKDHALDPSTMVDQLISLLVGYVYTNQMALRTKILSDHYDRYADNLDPKKSMDGFADPLFWSFKDLESLV